MRERVRGCLAEQTAAHHSLVNILYPHPKLSDFVFSLNIHGGYTKVENTDQSFGKVYNYCQWRVQSKRIITLKVQRDNRNE